MKHLYFLLVICFCSSSFGQSAEEAIKNRITSTLGKDCIIKNENGQVINFDQASQQILQISMTGKRTYFKPIHVINGIRKEVVLTPTEKPLKNTDEVDFTNKKLLFRDSTGKSISADVFRKTLEDNPTLLASAYNAQNGIISEYQIKPAPQPVKLALNSSSNPEMVNKVLSDNQAFKIGDQMPSFVVTDIQGKKWTMEELQNKIVVMNFWFVECPPCIEEIPSLNKLVEEYKNNQNVVFLAFSNSDKAKIDKFLKNKTFSYNHIPQEQSKFFLEQWKIKVYPINMIVNKGKVAFSRSGGLKSEKEDIMYLMLKNEIQKCI
ncbi:MAG: TlpA family protein disulfide reductase [Raineya sp.]|jgi:thiol-disulfide isomerase/thioredoxin|nr:TlpA family protein disulfide reductase [Raineya sp.]